MTWRSRREGPQVFDFGLPGYVPTWTNDLDALVTTQSGRLGDLVGRRLVGASLMWDAKRDVWWADGPVVLDFDGVRLEINHQKFDDLSITWDTIDLDRPIRWAGSRRPKLRWRHDVPQDLAELHGRPVTGVQLLRWASDDPTDLGNGSPEVGFAFGVREMTVFNALDENGLWFGPLGRHHQVVWSAD